MIYFVDEDVVQLEPFKIELEILGFEVCILQDADEAYEVLCVPNEELELAIIDVMLAADFDIERSRFDRESTRDFLETGLVLLEQLKAVNPENFPRRAMLFSTATNTDLVQAVTQVAATNNIPYLDKNNYVNAWEFGQKVEETIMALAERV
jgi:hypothetical protein